MRFTLFMTLILDTTFLYQVQRTYQDFLELDEFLRTSVDFSRMSGLPQRLPQLHDGDTAPLSSFLQQILLQMGGFLWNCPRLLCFLDDTHGKQSLRDAQVGVLNQKVNPVAIIFPPLSMYDWDNTTSLLLAIEMNLSFQYNSVTFFLSTAPGFEYCIQNARDQTLRCSGHLGDHQHENDAPGDPSHGSPSKTRRKRRSC